MQLEKTENHDASMHLCTHSCIFVHLFDCFDWTMQRRIIGIERQLRKIESRRHPQGLGGQH